ncbi:MAG: response regulator transcription factor [Thermomicrobiales bacterium]
MDSLRLLVVEDEALFREMLVLTLEGEPGLEVVGQADNGQAAIRLAAEHQPDVVLMDIEMPGEYDGIDAGIEIRKANSSTGIVLLSSHRDRRFFTSLPADQQAGWSYLLKQSVGDIETVIRAIRGSAAGMVVLDPALIGEMRPKPDSALSRLTPRQHDVLELIAQGYSNSAIADELSLTERSVETYVSVIYQELGVSGEREIHARVKATLMALEESTA